MKKILLFLFLSIFYTQAQDDSYSEEVLSIQKKYDTLWDASKPTIVFTGSSSIRLWEDLEERFPEHQILNTGFGGSQSYDLLAHLKELVLNYQPAKVFVYEGDNDINAGKKPKEVLQTMASIVEKIKNVNPNTEIILISAKPSISRWRLRGKYKRLNKKLKELSESDKSLAFVNVWDTMLDGRKLNKSLFIEDGLHMNKAGYDIWYGQLKEHIKP